MKNILTFESFTQTINKENPNINEYALQYLNDEITSSQLEKYIFQNNEGVVGDAINYVKNKVIDVFYTFMIKAMNIKNVLTKIVEFGKKIFGYLKKFSEKHPTLTKAIMIFILMVIIFAITSQSSQAAEIVNGKLHMTNVDEINAAYGFIDQNYTDLLKGHATGIDAERIAFEAKVYLKDIIDGKLDSPIELKHEAVALAKSAIKTMQEAVNNVNDKQDSSQLSTILKYVKEGMSHVLTTAKVGNVTTVAL
jgi:hypothetical protein